MRADKKTIKSKNFNKSYSSSSLNLSSAHNEPVPLKNPKPYRSVLPTIFNSQYQDILDQVNPSPAVNPNEELGLIPSLIHHLEPEDDSDLSPNEIIEENYIEGLNANTVSSSENSNQNTANLKLKTDQFKNEIRSENIFIKFNKWSVHNSMFYFAVNTVATLMLCDGLNYYNGFSFQTILSSVAGKFEGF